MMGMGRPVADRQGYQNKGRGLVKVPQLKAQYLSRFKVHLRSEGGGRHALQQLQEYRALPECQEAWDVGNSHLQPLTILINYLQGRKRQHHQSRNSALNSVPVTHRLQVKRACILAPGRWNYKQYGITAIDKSTRG